MTPEKLIERTIEGTLGSDDLDYGKLTSVFDDSQKMLHAALEQDPDNAELKRLIGQNAQMVTLLNACGQADEAGNTDRLNEIAVKISELTGTVPKAGAALEGDIDQLQSAIEDNDILRAKAALDLGIDLNSHYGEFDDFPLRWAVMSGERSVEMIRLLLQRGADARFATSEGYTALHGIADYLGEADFNGTSEIVRILVQAGADMEARNHYGWTPLLMAVMQGGAEEMHALLANGANANAIYPDQSMPEFSRGKTALMNAAFDPAKVELLLNYGADPLAVAQNGEDFATYVIGQINHVTTTREPIVAKILLRFLGVKGMKRDMIAGLADSRDLVAAAAR